MQHTTLSFQSFRKLRKLGKLVCASPTGLSNAFGYSDHELHPIKVNAHDIDLPSLGLIKNKKQRIKIKDTCSARSKIFTA